MTDTTELTTPQDNPTDDYAKLRARIADKCVSIPHPKTILAAMTPADLRAYSRAAEQIARAVDRHAAESAHVVTMPDGQQWLCPDPLSAEEHAEMLGPDAFVDQARVFKVPLEFCGEYRYRPNARAFWTPNWPAPEPGAGNGDWRSLFHSAKETAATPNLTFAINGFLQADGITMLGGLPGHAKTLVALAMVRALLEDKPLFDIFAVSPAVRVLYLIPESSLSPFVARLRTFRLTEYVGDTLFYRTLSADGNAPITDPRILEAAQGADVFLDTAVRFMEGDENAAAEQRQFADNLFALLRAGARSVTGLHHSPKATEKADYMSLENMLRGSGDIGAMLATCWGLRQTNKATNQVFIENVKPRDFQPCEPFIIEGRPHLDQTGYFKVIAKPGEAGTLNQHKPRRPGDKPSGRPTDPDREAKVQQMVKLRAERVSYREIASTLKVSKDTVRNWLRDYDDEKAIDAAIPANNGEIGG